jgi:type VI secretion system protein VasJ
MMNASNSSNWRFVAVGKHPVAKDFLKLGESIPQVNDLSAMMKTAYSTLMSRFNSAPGFSSWRFWSKGSGKDSLICGIVRDSSDKMGRPYPFLIIGSGQLKDWEFQWDLLPFACENTWCQFEYLSTQNFEHIKKLEEELANIRPPTPHWAEHSDRRRSLNRIGSPLDPFASFLDLKKLKGQVAGLSDQKEYFVSLDRGPCHDKILPVSLWHHLFMVTLKSVPQTVFMGGTLDKAFLVAYSRTLKPEDAVQLWSVPSAASWPNIIGTEYSVDISMLGKEPISADCPCGSDVRYEAEFQTLQNEIDKLSLPSAEGSVNWEKVVRFASDILAHQSKDLLVAIYLSVALTYTRKHDGLSMGVKLLMDLMGKFWEQLYPSRERTRGRLRALEWWVEKMEAALKLLPQDPVPGAQVCILKDHLNHVEQWIVKHLENPPSLTTIRNLAGDLTVVREVPFSKETVKSSVSPVITDDAKSRQSHVSSAVMPEAIQSFPNDGRMREHYMQKIREIGSHCRQQNEADPLPYRLNRKVLWCNIEDLPMSTNGLTRIPAPDKQIVKMLFDLQDSGDAGALLKAAEGRLPQFIFWVELNRFVAESLARLGANYAKAYRAVCRETAFLIYQLPGLEDLSFSDGTPFATLETKNWLKSIAIHSGISAQTASDTRLDFQGGKKRMAEEITEAQGMIQEGRLLEAMEGLQQKLNAASAGREKIIWRLEVARLLLDVKRYELALPHLDQIIQDVDHFHLENYDSALALKVLKMVCTGLGLQKDESLKSKKSDVLYRIAKIDMAEAIRLGNS